MTEIGNIFVRIGARTNEFEGAMRKLEQSIKDAQNRFEGLGAIGDRLTGVGQKVALAGGAIATGFGFAVKTAADFDAQMSKVRALAGASESDFNRLREAAIELGAQSVYSASEAARGMQTLAAAGFDTNQVIAAMPGLLDAAAAAGEDFGVVSNIMVAAMSGFGLQAQDMGRIADVLASTANASAISITDIGYSFKYVAPVAKTAGVSLEEAAAALAILGNAGIKADSAGTALRMSLIRLADPPKEAAATLAQLGIKTTDASGKMLPFGQIIGQLHDKFQGLSQAQRLQAASTIFGAESMSAMLTLIEAGPEKLDALTTEFQNSTGAAQQMADTMMDNLAGSVEQLKGALESAFIIIGTALTPAIQSIALLLQRLVDWFNQLPAPVQRGIAVFGALSAVLAVVGGAFFMLLGWVMQAISGLAALGPLFAGLAGPIGIVVAAIAGIIAVGALLLANWNTIKAAAATVWNVIAGWITSAWQTVQTVTTTIWTAIWSYLQPIWDGLSQIATTIFTGIGTIISTVWNGIQTITQAIWAGIQAYLSGNWEGVKQAALTIWEAVKSTISGVWMALASMVGPIWEGIKLVLVGIWNVLVALAVTAWEGIKQAILTRWDAIKTGTTIIWDGIKNFLGDLWDALVILATTVWDALRGAIVGATETTEQALSEVWSGIRDFVGGIWDTIKSWAFEKWEAVKVTITTITGDISSTLNQKWNGIKESLAGIWEGVKSLAREKWEAVKDIIRGVINGIIGIVNRFIRFWNSIKIRVPKIDIPFVGTVGGFTVSVPEIPEIPMLAEGGIVTAPTLAVVGERGPEVVVPLSGGGGGLVDAIAEAVERGSYAGTYQGIRIASASNQGSGQQEIVLRIDSTTFARLILPAIIKEGQRQGLRLVAQPQGV